MIVSLFGDTYCTNFDCIDPRCDAIRGMLKDANLAAQWARSGGNSTPASLSRLRNCEKRRIARMFDYTREHETTSASGIRKSRTAAYRRR